MCTKYVSRLRSAGIKSRLAVEVRHPLLDFSRVAVRVRDPWMVYKCENESLIRMP